MIQLVFYQILEYVIAPIGLIIFAFFIKKDSQKENLVKRHILSENAIENLFISSYSHLMYYFSLTGHTHEGLCNREQFAALLSAIFGLLLLFIYKYSYEQLEELQKEKLRKQINFTSIGLLLFLTIIIAVSSINIHHIDIQFSVQIVKQNFLDILNFVFQINNVIFIAFIVLILYLYFDFQKTKPNASRIDFEKASSEPLQQTPIHEFERIASNEKAPLQIRLSSYVKVAAYYKKVDSSKALLAITNAKDLAVSNNYPEHQLVAIRNIKAELHCINNQKQEAERELTELRISQTKSSDVNKEFYPHWIEKLERIVKCCTK